MKNIKLCGILAAVSGTLLISAGSTAMADSTTDLLNALVAKGVLTEEEAAPLMKGHEVETQKKNSEITASFKDGITFESADHQNSLSVNGRVQADYHYYAKQDAQNTDTWDIRRAYLSAKGKFYNYYDFKVQADFAQGQNGNSNDQLDEAYFGINWWDQAKFRFGQFDMPFGLEHYTSDLFLDFAERGLTEALVPTKERGAMIFGVPFKGTYYALAVNNGRGKNANNVDNQIDGVEVLGRVTANLAEIFGQDGAVYHIGGDISHANISPNQKFSNGVLANNAFLVGYGNATPQTEGRGITFFVPGSLSVPANQSVERNRYGLEGAVAYGPVKLQSEWMKHNYSGNNTAIAASAGLPAVKAGSFDNDITAWYASLNWAITGENYADSYKNGVWGRIKPKSDFVHPSAGYGTGAWIIGLRYSDYDAGDFATGPGRVSKSAVGTATAASPTTPTGAHAWTGGIMWILNPNTRFLLDYTYTKFEGGVITFTNNQTPGTKLDQTDSENALTLRGQFDF